MPNKNQKEMSEMELKKLAEAQKVKKTKRKQTLQELKQFKKEKFEEEKKLLPQILSEKTKEIAELFTGNELFVMSYAEIYSIISRSDQFAVRKIYSNDELYIAFKEFQRVVNQINFKIQFVPTINIFCAYIGVSTSTYKSWLASNDEERREVVQMIDDYLADVALSLAQSRKLDGLVTMYRTKSQHNMVEATSPIIIEHRKGADMEEISERLNMIKKGGLVLDADYKEKGKK